MKMLNLKKKKIKKIVRKKIFFKKIKKNEYFNNKIFSVSYGDYSVVKRFLNSSSKIVSSKLSSVNFCYQKKIKLYIKYYRFLSLLPYTSNHIFNNY